MKKQNKKYLIELLQMKVEYLKNCVMALDGCEGMNPYKEELKIAEDTLKELKGGKK